MNNANGPVSCAICGFGLGMGITGTTAYCSRCGEYVITKAVQNESSQALEGMLALVVGTGAAVLFLGILNTLFGEKG